MYFLEVSSNVGDTNTYDLEIENFQAPVPSVVALDPADDTGMSNGDNVTAEDLARVFVEADLNDFALEGIDILDPTEVAAGEPGAAVEVFVNGRQCVAVRVYPGRADSVGVSLRSQGSDATLRSLDAWQMKSIYE